jgi:hypothetical protein
MVFIIFPPRTGPACRDLLHDISLLEGMSSMNEGCECDLRGCGQMRKCFWNGSHMGRLLRPKSANFLHVDCQKTEIFKW